MRHPARFRRAPRVPLASCVLIASLFLGCGEDEHSAQPCGTGDAPSCPPPDAVTIDLLFGNLERAYTEKDVEQYRRLFVEEQFTFAFAQVDLDRNPEMEPTWGWEPEFRSARGIFDSDIAYSIRCDLSDRDAAVPAIEADQLGLPPETLQRTQKIRVRHARVEIDTVSESGEPLTLAVRGDAQEFFVLQHGQTGAGDPLWKIVHWKDKATRVVAVGRPTRSTSWGLLKGSYHF